jgi:CheY-like chemotaxis protein
METAVVGADVLGIDDLQDTVEGIVSQFQLMGLRVHTASSLDAAMERLATVKYRLLLVDLRMPEAGPVGGVYLEAGEPADDDMAGLRLVCRLRAGDFGALNQLTPYAVVSAQAYRLEHLEQELEPGDLALVRAGRLDRFRKGQSVLPFVRRMITAIQTDESG